MPPSLRRPLALLAALVLAAAPAWGKDAPPPPAGAKTKEAAPDRVLAPMLWRVTGKGLKEPSYLFGTIHLSDPRITRMHPLSRAAFKKSATLHTEIELDDQGQAEMMKALSRTDGRKLGEAIGPELTKQLDAELKHINPILSTALFQPLQTWAVAVSLGSLEDQLKGGTALDQQLWDKAQAAGKRCGALETMAEHVGGFKALTDAEQVLLLKSSLESQAKQRAGKAPFSQADLVALYLKGDEQTLGRIEEMEEEHEKPTPEEKALGEKVKQFLLLDRNVVMAKAIMKECAAHPEQSHFFAAGTAHFAGEGNVRELLEKEGFTVERVGTPAEKATGTAAPAGTK